METPGIANEEEIQAVHKWLRESNIGLQSVISP
jgi:hypothetical protein